MSNKPRAKLAGSGRRDLGCLKPALAIIVACLAIWFGASWLYADQGTADIPRSTTPDNIPLFFKDNGDSGTQQPPTPPRLDMMTHAGFLGLQAAGFETGSDFHRLLEQAANDLKATAPDTARVAASAGRSHGRFRQRLEDLARQVGQASISSACVRPPYYAVFPFTKYWMNADSLLKCVDTQAKSSADDIAQGAVRAIRAYRAKQCELWGHSRSLREKAGKAEASLGLITEEVLRNRHVHFDRVQRGSIPWAYLNRCAKHPGKADCPSLKDLVASYDRAIRGGDNGWLSFFFSPDPTPAQIHQALGNLTDRGVVSQHAEFSRRSIRKWGNWAGEISDQVEMSSPIWDALESRAMMYCDGDWPGHGEGAVSLRSVEDGKKGDVLGLLEECMDVLSVIDVDGRVKL